MSLKKAVVGSLVCVSLFLSGCSSDGKKDGQPIEPTPVALAVKAIVGALKPAAAPVDPRKQLTREAIDASPVPVLFAEIESRRAFATLSKVGENRSVASWLTADGVGLYFKHGLLVATRGLGPDLMGADVSDVLSILRSGQGSAVRIHDYLNGEDQIVRRSFYCTTNREGAELLNVFGLRISTQHIVETCKNPEITFENHHWISSENRIWQSKQWIGPEIGYVFTQQLSR